jgi:acylphosphatase
MLVVRGSDLLLCLKFFQFLIRSGALIESTNKVPMAVQAKQIIVYGRVQGVGFRYFVQHTGNRLGLAGNVRNCPDSTVEIYVEGDERKIADFIKQVKKGPSLSRVQSVDVIDSPVRGTYSSFLIEGW